MNRRYMPYIIATIFVVGGFALLWLSNSEEKKLTAETATTTPTTATTTAATTTVAAQINNSSSTTTNRTPLATTSPTLQMKFEIVMTPAAQQQGLGGRAVIPDNYAMLFVFPTDESIGFWMKDMLTSIDMIWVSDSGSIVAIDSSVSPDTYPEVFYPPVPVKYVLETKAGFAHEKGWKIGTHVELPLPY